MCSSCKQEKLAGEFVKSKNLKKGYINYCKPCWSEKSRLWRKENPNKSSETSKRYRLNNPDVGKNYRRTYYGSTKQKETVLRHKMSKYGSSLEEYVRLYEEQKGLCKICKEEDNFKNPICIDHCHSKNLFRGLICKRCNTVLGYIKDNVAILEGMLRYLECK
jgi:hypothetical protein